MTSSPGPSTHPFGALTSFASRVLLATGIVVAVGLLLTLLWFAIDVMLVTFAGVLLALLIRGPVDWLAQRTPLSERWSLVLVSLVIVVALGGLGFFLADTVAAQTEELLEQLPESAAALERWVNSRPAAKWLVELVPDPAELDRQMVFQATGVAYTAFQTIFHSLVLLFVTIYLVVHPRLYIQGLLRLIPPADRPRAAEVLGATGYTLRWWLIGSLIRMLAVGIMTYLGLWFLDVPLAFLLAIVAFLFDFVPYFGPIVAAIPGVLLALIQGPEQALYVTLMYVVIQQIESLLIAPLAYQRTVYLPPVLTILSQILLFAMVGAMGIALATPLVAVALVGVKMLYIEQVLGDRLPTPDKEMPDDDVPQLPESEQSE